MAEDAVDRAVLRGNLQPKTQSRTHNLFLRGGEHFTPTLYIRLVQQFCIGEEVPPFVLSFDFLPNHAHFSCPKIARHLASRFGTQALEVAELTHATPGRWPKAGPLLINGYPYLEAEVTWACRQEFAVTATDVIARRTRLAFLDIEAATEALPSVVRLMAAELHWDAAEQEKQTKHALLFMQSLGPVSGYPRLQAALQAHELK
jgi:glycerol-3-phosphate dehydrogenase